MLLIGCDCGCRCSVDPFRLPEMRTTAREYVSVRLNLHRNEKLMKCMMESLQTTASHTGIALCEAEAPHIKAACESGEMQGLDSLEEKGHTKT